jgi:hypothetical protein
MTQDLKLQIEGHLLIQDAITGETVVDKKNAIHPENMSLAIAQSLARKSQGPIWKMAFGNGGSVLSGVGTVTYLTPNVVGATATLYNSTFPNGGKIVNDQDSNNTDPIKNNMVISHTGGTVFSDIIISCTLETGEPLGQNALDNTSNINSPFVFDEIGIINYDSRLLTHVIFSPVEKSTNRSFTITYTIRIQLI